MRSISVFVVKAKQLRNAIYILYLSSRDRRVPLYVKILLLMIIAYALSPVDIVPDFIPVLGYIDDLIILPLGLYFVFKLIPEEVKAEYQQKAGMQLTGSHLKWVGLTLVILIWLLTAFWIIVVFWF